MRCRDCILTVLGAAFLLLCFPFVASPQSSAIPKGCVPQQSFPDEETRVRLESGQTPPRIVIDSVEIENPTGIPQNIQDSVIAAARDHTLSDTGEAVQELNETGIRGILQTNGYFRAESTVNVRVASKDPTVEHVSLVVHIDLGAQYRMGKLSFRSAEADEPLAFSDAQLASFMHMGEGDIFDTDKLRQTFDDLKNFYGEHGYIDFTPTPDFDINDEARIINLALVLDQQQLYRVRGLEFIGNNPAVEQAVRERIKSGMPVDSDALSEFADWMSGATKNPALGLADFVFDFRPCPNR